MINLNLINSPVENKLSFSTPKFSQTLLDKESHNKNNSLGFDLPSFEEPKFSTTKKNSPILIKKEFKDINTNINPFKENFSLSSILNEKNNDEKNSNDNDNSDKVKNKNENKKINLININIENPSKKAKIKKALISFGDKSENENNSLCNNEIIYREKIDNSSLISNKEKKTEENKGNQNNNVNNIALEKKDSDNAQNISGSFQYSLPLENDKAPTASDFFIFDETNNNNILKVNGKEEKNEMILENKLDDNPINTDRIVNEKDKSESKENNNNVKMTYSKEKPKRSKTERQSMTHKFLINDEILEKIDEKILNSEYKNKNKKKIKINSLLNSNGNTKKFRRKIKYDSINISLEKNKETNDDISLSGNTTENLMKNTPQKKLAIIKELKYFNLPKIKEDNFYQIKNYSSRENLQLNKNNCDLNNKNVIKGRNTLNKNIKSEINLNSYYSNQKKFKNLKFNKFPNLFSDFQKFKKIKQNENLNSINTVRESTNYNNIINSNIINNTNAYNNYNNTIIGANSNSKKFFIKKNTNRGILGHNNNKKNIIIEPKNINKTRNLDNIISRNSNKEFNSALFNTINYVNTELKTITSINKNNNKKILNNKIKQIVQIKKSLPEFQKAKKNINKINNNNTNNQQNYKFVKNKNNNINNFENQNKFQTNNNKNKISLNSHKPNNFVNINYNNPKSHKRQKKFYNKFIYNIFETNPNTNNKTQNENQIKSNVQNNINNKETIMNKFINQNSSTNSLQNDKYNKIKVHMLFNNHNKTGTSPNLFSEDNTNNLWKIYKKPKNTCLVNQFSNDYNTIGGKKNYIKKKINILKSDLSEINSGNKSNKNSQIIHLRKRFINSSNLTGRNSISKFENKSNEAINKHQRSSMQELNINMEKIYSNIKNSPRIEEYNEKIIKFSILRNNLNNKVINEFSITVGDKNNEDNENDMKNNIKGKNKININNKKNIIRKEGTNNDKKTIINVNQYYPSYFINAQNQNFKEKK